MRAAFALAGLAALAAADHACPLTNGTFPAAAWPSQHTRTEQMYTPLTGPEWSSKPIWYDYDNNHYRADSFFESGNANPLTTLYNFTSIWINQTLSMITYADPRSLQPESCIQLNLGIGMMRPDWMVAPASQCMGDIWITSKSAGFDDDYHRAVWTRISALDQDDGNFDWFSDYTTGVGRMMQAPGQDAADYVVNEEFSLMPAQFAPSSPIFALPAGIKCIPVAGGEVASSFAHAHALMSAEGKAHLLRALPEVKLAFRLAALDAARRA